MNPFTKILNEIDIDPNVEGPAVKDHSLNEEGERDRDYVKKARDIFENPVFEKEFKLHLQYIWHAMTEDSFAACKLSAAFFNEFFKRFQDLTEEAKAMEDKDKPALPNEHTEEPLPPGEVSEAGGFEA